MNGSGKAGNGRGNNWKRPFKRWDKENNTWQEKEPYLQGNDTSKVNENPHRNRAFHKGSNGVHEKKTQNHGQNSENQGRQNRGGHSRRGSQSPLGEKPSFVERPKWIPPTMNTEPLPVPSCPWCGKPIRDISSAIADKDTGVPVHFDCVASRIALNENLEKGDVVVYIGAGRFGVVNFGVQDNQDRGSGRTDQDRRSENSSSAPAADARTGLDRRSTGASQEGLDWNRDFKIKKVIEWENKEKRAVWRSAISDHYSVT